MSQIQFAEAANFRTHFVNDTVYNFTCPSTVVKPGCFWMLPQPVQNPVNQDSQFYS